MSDRPDLSEWLSERLGLTVLTALSISLAILIVLPYLQYVLLGGILAYILMPAQRRLEDHIRPMAAALVLVVVAVLVILLPVMYVLTVALQQALEIGTAIQEGTLNTRDFERLLAETGYVVDLEKLYGAYQEPISTGLQGLAPGVVEFVGGVPTVLIGLTVTVFVLFSLLRDGDRLISWLQYVLPVNDDVQRELLVELDQLMWASVVGNVAVAIVQALLLGVGLAVLGVPAVVLFTVATFLAALLPLIGVFVVWLPVSLYLFAAGNVVLALVLVIYGSLVSVSDTYLRPALIGRTSAFNSAIVVVGIFGGLVVFGAVGLFIGPVVLGGAKITLDVFAREWAASGEEPPETPESTEDPAAETDVDMGIATAQEHDMTEKSDSAAEEDGPVDTTDLPESNTDTDPTP